MRSADKVIRYQLHAIKRMRRRGISKEQADRAVHTGKKGKARRPDSVKFALKISKKTTIVVIAGRREVDLDCYGVAKINTQSQVGFEMSISGRNDGTLEALYITLRAGKAHTTREVVEDIVLADYDNHGRLIGIEILAPVKISKLTPLVEPKRRKPFRDFVTTQAPQDLVLS